MALSTITSMFPWSDVLTETKMEPWWEVVRGKCVAVMFITASAMLTLSLTSTIHCLPTFSNMTLTNTEILYVNELCYDNLPSYSSHNLGTYVIAIALGIHIWYSWWLLVPSVKEKFHDVRNADDRLKELDLMHHGIKDLALCKPFDSRIIQQTNENKTVERSNEDKRISVRNVFRRLWSCHQPTRVVTLYFVRNIVGFFLLSGTILFSIFSFKLTGQNIRYSCKVTLTVREVTFHDFTCSNELSHVPFLALLSAYTASIIMQWLLTTIVPLYYKYLRIVNDWMLIKRFAASSTKLSEGTENLLLDKDEVVKTMTYYLEKAVEVGDFDYLDLYLKLGDSAEIIVNKKIRESFKQRIYNNEVKDEDLSKIVKFCSEKAMYESFVLAHYKNFGQNSEKNYDYKDCGCCNLKINLRDKDTYTKKSLLHYVLKLRTKTENGQDIFNRLAIKHLLYWIIERSSPSEIPVVTLQPAQNNQSDIQEENETSTRVQVGSDAHVPLLETSYDEERRRSVQQENEGSNIVCNDEIELFELSLILRECGYGVEIGITPENRNRYNVYRAVRYPEHAVQQVDFVFEYHKSFYHKSFYRRMSTFWFKNKMFKEYFHLHKLLYDENICPEMDKFDTHGYCGCNELNFEQDDTEPGPSGCSLLYYVLENPDVNSEAMKHVLCWMSKWKGWQDRNVIERNGERIQLSVSSYLNKVCKRILSTEEANGIMGSFLQVAAKALDLEVMSLPSDTREGSKYLRDGLVTRIEQCRVVTNHDLETITRFCMEHKLYEVWMLVHYKWFGQNSDKDFDYDKCGCHENQDRFKEGLTDCLSTKSLLHCVLDSHNRTDETTFNPIVTEHFLYWIWKHRDNEVWLERPETDCVQYQRDHPEKLELSFLLNKHGYGDDVGFTDENHLHHNFYRAIRIGGEVTAEMKNFVFGDDKSFYKELSQFWLRNKFYREYVELHKLFYSFPRNRNHETIDCGCNEMTFHLTDTEPGSKGRSLIYYILFLVNLDPGSEAMTHVLKWGRKRQDVSELREVKVVIRGESYVDCSPMEYVKNFNEPDRERLIQALQEFGYH